LMHASWQFVSSCVQVPKHELRFMHAAVEVHWEQVAEQAALAHSRQVPEANAAQASPPPVVVASSLRGRSSTTQAGAIKETAQAKHMADADRRSRAREMAGLEVMALTKSPR